MKDIKYIGLFIVMLCQFGFSVYGVTTKGLDQLGGEKLKYVVTYKWGLINKEAGDAILTLNDRGNYYDIKMTAKSHPWADKVFMVRDTLVTKVRKEGFKPEQYHKAAYEGGKYSLDIVDFRYEGSKVKGHCERIRDKKGKERDTPKTSRFACGCSSMSFASMPALETESASNTSLKWQLACNDNSVDQQLLPIPL